MIFVAKKSSGQEILINYAISSAAFSPLSSFPFSLKHNTSKGFKIPMIRKADRLSNLMCSGNFIISTPNRVISADYYSRNFGFFCKKELEFEKKTKIPLRFRLGSLQYTDYLEGKPNAGILPAN